MVKSKKKQKCSLGASCPYKDRYQHQLEFYHDNDEVSSNGNSRKSSNNSINPFSGTGHTIKRTIKPPMHEPPRTKRACSTVSVVDMTTSSTTTTTTVPSAAKRRKKDHDSKRPSFHAASATASAAAAAPDTSVIVLDDSDDEDRAANSKRKRRTLKNTKFSNTNDDSLVDLCDDDNDDNEKQNSKMGTTTTTGRSTIPSRNEVGKRSGIHPLMETTARSKRRKYNNSAKMPVTSANSSSSSTVLPGVFSPSNFASSEAEVQKQVQKAIAASNRDIQNDQDREYYESLRMDQAKERSKQEEEEFQKAMKESAKLAKQEEEQEKDRRRQHYSQQLEPEPPAASTECATIAFRLPANCSTTRITRRFRNTATADQLLAYLHSCDELRNLKSWTLRQVMGGGKEIDETMSLVGLGLVPRGVVIVRDETC